MKKTLTRIYNIGQAELIKLAKTTVGNLSEYLTDFTALDSTINAAKITSLNTLIDNATNNLSDKVISDRQVQLTNKVKAKMQEAQDHYQLISYFVKKTFPDNLAIRNEFGENDYSGVKSSQAKMILFMKELHSVTVKYQTKIVKAGCKQKLIDEILTLYNQLNDANHEQELYKGRRPVLTNERIIIFNQIWKELYTLGEAAKIIYKNDSSKLKLFLLPYKYNNHKEDLQAVKPGETLVTIAEGVEQDTYFKIENSSETELIFYVAEEQLEAIPEKTLVLSAEEEKIFLANDISNETYGKLIVSNQTSILISPVGKL